MIATLWIVPKFIVKHHNQHGGLGTSLHHSFYFRKVSSFLKIMRLWIVPNL